MEVDNGGENKPWGFDAEPEVKTIETNKIKKPINSEEAIEGFEYKRVGEESGKIEGETGHDRGWSAIFRFCKEEGIEWT